MAAAAHPSSPPCTPSPPEWNQQKQIRNPSEGPTLFHVKNSKWPVYGKKFGMHFFSPFKESGYRCAPTMFTPAGDEYNVWLLFITL